VVAVFDTGAQPRRMVVLGRELWVTNTGAATVQILDLTRPGTPEG
jgi:hypothetical protein